MTEQRIMLELVVNGVSRTATVRAADTLLDVLREELGLTGAKPSCLTGDCGACTVQVGGIPLKSCVMLALEAAGCSVKTVEGLSNRRLQEEVIRQAAFQCGYCTPGFLMNIDALQSACPHADASVIREWMESNLCRCMGYVEIEAAIRSVMAGADGNTQDD